MLPLLTVVNEIKKLKKETEIAVAQCLYDFVEQSGVPLESVNIHIAISPKELPLSRDDITIQVYLKVFPFIDD